MSDSIIAYEVIRVINSKPLFIREHFRRFRSTLFSVNYSCNISASEFFLLVCATIKNKAIVDGNIRIDAEFTDNNRSCAFAIGQLPHKYPTIIDYKEGIATSTYLHERINPHNKIWNRPIRQIVADEKKLKGVSEVLYIDANNIFSEGSRSNLFFIKGKKLISPPSSRVLLGITRKFVIKAAKSCGCEYIEQDVSLDDVSGFDAAFISGTSPKILPIQKINAVSLDVNNQYMKQLMQEFNNIIEKDLDEFDIC